MSTEHENTVSIGHGNHRIEITEHGCTILGDPSVEQWRSHLISLKKVKEIYHQALADLVKFGTERFGAAEVENTLTQLEFSLADGHHALAISSLPNTIRIQPNLSTEHQYVLGKDLAGDSAQQEHWGKVAEEANLSPQDLRLSISHGRIIRARERVNGIVSFESVVALFNRSARALQGVVLTEAQRMSIYDLLSPILNFAEALKAV
jgi:hypothetical protein